MMAHLWRPCCGCTQLIKMSSDNGNKLDYLANDMLSHKETRELQHRECTTLRSLKYFRFIASDHKCCTASR